MRMARLLPAEAADPVVEIIHRDEEDAGLLCRRIGGLERGQRE
jgi:hypothetical protein